jgi:exosortase
MKSNLSGLRPGDWLLLVAVLVFAVPTLLNVAQVSWSTEQGGHGPLVVATGLWLIVRQRSGLKRLRAPGSAVLGALWVLLCLTVYILTRITGIIEIESFAMYGALVGAAYLLWGPAVLRHFWFPIVYLALALPPPETLVAAVTQPIKIGISNVAVDLLYAVGYPIASSGVTIQIAQYELLMAAACAGLNSIISLTAIGLFYIYVLHNANYRYGRCRGPGFHSQFCGCDHVRDGPPRDLHNRPRCHSTQAPPRKDAVECVSQPTMPMPS